MHQIRDVKCKTRLIAQGFLEKYNSDPSETFAFVISITA